VIMKVNSYPQKLKSMMRIGLWDSAAAEALALGSLLVILGQEIGVQKMILEGDAAKQIIDAIQEKDRQDSMIGHLIDDVRLSLNNIPECKVDHVHREANRVAHGLTKLALKSGNETVWLEECPCIRDILLIDQLLCQ
jgi:hypothetical protein